MTNFSADLMLNHRRYVRPTLEGTNNRVVKAVFIVPSSHARCRHTRGRSGDRGTAITYDYPPRDLGKISASFAKPFFRLDSWSIMVSLRRINLMNFR